MALFRKTGFKTVKSRRKPRHSQSTARKPELCTVNCKTCTYEAVPQEEKRQLHFWRCRMCGARILCKQGLTTQLHRLGEKIVSIPHCKMCGGEVVEFIYDPFDPVLPEKPVGSITISHATTSLTEVKKTASFIREMLTTSKPVEREASPAISEPKSPTPPLLFNFSSSSRETASVSEETQPFKRRRTLPSPFKPMVSSAPALEPNREMEAKEEVSPLAPVSSSEPKGALEETEELMEITLQQVEDISRLIKEEQEKERAEIRASLEWKHISAPYPRGQSRDEILGDQQIKKTQASVSPVSSSLSSTPPVSPASKGNVLVSVPAQRSQTAQMPQMHNQAAQTRTSARSQRPLIAYRRKVRVGNHSISISEPDLQHIYQEDKRMERYLAKTLEQVGLATSQVGHGRLLHGSFLVIDDDPFSSSYRTVLVETDSKYFSSLDDVLQHLRTTFEGRKLKIVHKIGSYQSVLFSGTI